MGYLIKNNNASSGTWIPTIVTDYEESIVYNAFYTKIDEVVNFSIRLGLVNSINQITHGNINITTPNNDNISEINAGVNFETELSTLATVLVATTFAINGSSFDLFIDSTGALASYTLCIQGQYTLS
jgi:hypothetical protein